MRQVTLFLLAATGALALTGCGDKQASESGTASEAATAGGAAGALPADWKATDACTILDKGAVAKALKIDVPQTQLSLVNEPGAQSAATSTCTYLGSDGASVASLMTRWSPIGDNTPETIAATRSTTASTMKAFSDKPLEDIPGLGKAAFLVPGINQLNVFVDEARMMILTVEKVPDGASGKDIAVDLAKQAGA
ncbi:hypothetical protein [Novosphingobium album (ex Liu et al. 2023)]|uniref:DUF3558 domain-containing protein n=1 Tax=Novosphingobium album (ex Liu et al. 2023) TaxID=3031130 RepID=A0ABT5WL56_9SPHN|nr:hypothetical protein [Novosphingobium album (ex Liu et al. 2023)]MDE8650750.1 hypothetical protein [Novosphingobium album (ex Liu et al. 2023)]